MRHFFCRTRSASLILGLVFFTSCTGDEPSEMRESGRTLDYRATVHFLAGDADTVSTIQAAVADTDAARSTGLMDIHEMPMNRGMLFVFQDEAPRSFWMANTPLALDIIFVSEEMEIVRIHRDTRPYSERNVESEVPARYVVETNAGYTLRHDIREGMAISIEY